ncbi:hypothetical protein PoB_001358500 [Plakobranchus ocellatus]|uniref:Uncharacterized protein n=1 Tax=Plakobranchus ocellatus TaxID=259542 RepID=A0AAV3YV63_9GAST|nr:hypothetical protein PoB_001358500 [Plakobranchus ocellatus]
MDDNMLLHINTVRSAVRRSSFHTLWGSSAPHSTPFVTTEDCLQPYQFHGWEDSLIRQHQRSRSRSRCYNRSLLLPDICGLFKKALNIQITSTLVEAISLEMVSKIFSGKVG